MKTIGLVMLDAVRRMRWAYYDIRWYFWWIVAITVAVSNLFNQAGYGPMELPVMIAFGVSLATVAVLVRALFDQWWFEQRISKLGQPLESIRVFRNKESIEHFCKRQRKEFYESSAVFTLTDDGWEKALEMTDHAELLPCYQQGVSADIGANTVTVQIVNRVLKESYNACMVVFPELGWGLDMVPTEAAKAGAVPITILMTITKHCNFYLVPRQEECRRFSHDERGAMVTEEMNRAKQDISIRQSQVHPLSRSREMTRSERVMDMVFANLADKFGYTYRKTPAGKKSSVVADLQVLIEELHLV